jgi:two-component system, OmpR family, sensor histidine kinase KdpD
MLDRLLSRPLQMSTGLAYLCAAAVCVLVTLLALPLRGVLDLANIVMLFLLGVVAVSLAFGRKPAVLAAFLSVALFDFFFVPPHLSFAVADVQYLLTFAVMLFVALVVAHLTTGLQRLAMEARGREQQSLALYALAKTLAGALSVEQAVSAMNAFMAHHGMAVTLLLPDTNDTLRVAPASMLALNNTELTASKAVFHNANSIDSATLSADEHRRFYQYLAGSTRARGVLVVAGNENDDHILQKHRALIEAVGSLIATALERMHFVDVAQRSQLEVHSERLRGTILSALSHDVRTPLTAIYGLADTLVLARTQPPDGARETAVAIRDQALRLNNMVSNLLDMARLQAGRIHLRLEWQPLEEVIGASIKLLGESLRAHKINVYLPANLPLMRFDAVLMERVFCNLLENAAKYAFEHAPIEITAKLEDACAEVSIRNAGAGFPSGKLDTIFALFERGSAGASVAGFGVGLAICRVIVEAHGGHIHAVNPPGGGACVRFTLPLGEPPSIEPEVAQ